MRRLRQRVTRRVDAQDLALAASPALALFPERRSVDGTCMPTSACGSYAVCQPREQPPAQVDVLRRHPRVVAADGEHAVAAEEPEDARDDADPPGQRLGAADQADDRRRLQHLQG